MLAIDMLQLAKVASLCADEFHDFFFVLPLGSRTLIRLPGQSLERMLVLNKVDVITVGTGSQAQGRATVVVIVVGHGGGSFRG